MALMVQAEREALHLLADRPKGAEVSIAGIDDHEIWIGVGLLVGKGRAIYRGDWTFKLTDAGWAYVKELAAD